MLMTEEQEVEFIRKLREKCDALALDMFSDEDIDARPEIIKMASLGAQETIARVYVMLGKIESVCEQCGHAVVKHFDTYGCQHEHGDRWVDADNASGWEAQGPCGCKAWTLEEAHATQS